MSTTELKVQGHKVKHIDLNLQRYRARYAQLL